MDDQRGQTTRILVSPARSMSIASRLSSPSGDTRSLIMSSQLSATDDDIFSTDREIKCPVHGYIPLSKLITSIIDTPQFQRLRYLKQLGTSYFVWPGASHNRFEHSIGTYHLSRLMIQKLRESQPSLGITNRDERCVAVAGLCHDLGHGPFSHVWDSHFIPSALPGSKWKHEDASEMMLDYLVADNNTDLQPDEVRFIKDLIYGAKRHTKNHSPPEKDFLFDIVANKRNGIDVDKFDYIARDTQAISSGTITDIIRLINSARVIDGQICYSEKNATTVYGLFQERFNLHKTIYNHKTAKSIEFMIVDALLLADPYLKISERIFDPKRFIHLTDDILLEVERSETPELVPARAIIRRIRVRDHYKLVDKTFLPWDSREFWLANFSPEKIVETAKSLQCPEFENPEVKKLLKELSKSHVIVDLTALHHGMGDRFPLDNCKFYGKYNPRAAFPPRREEDISHLLPKGFGELWNRVFTREARFLGVVQRAARALHENVILSSHAAQRSATPEVVRTPTVTSSFSSILSGSGNDSATQAMTPAPSVALLNAPLTPFHNNYMTVPPTFSPQKSAVVTRKRDQKGKPTLEELLENNEDSAGTLNTRLRKRIEDNTSRNTDSLGSPKKKKKRAN